MSMSELQIGAGDPEVLPEFNKPETVVVAENKFQPHPESYKPRVFIQTNNGRRYYELLQTGEAIQWTKSPEDRGFDFWIIDTGDISDFGMYRDPSKN